MTYFISSEYQKKKSTSKKEEAERPRNTSHLPAEPLKDYLPAIKGISDAFKDDLLSLDPAHMAPFTGRDGALARDQWPNHVTREHILIQAEAIWNLSRECALHFLGAAPAVLGILSRGEFSHWVVLGRKILKIDVGGEALCLAYFKTSPDLIQNDSIHIIDGWVEEILAIASISAAAALSFCRHSPAFVAADRAFHLRKWAGNVRQVLNAGKGCETAAIAFIKTSPRIVKKITFKELESWGSIGAKIAAKTPALAQDYFSHPPEALNSLYNIEILKFLQLTSLLADVESVRVMDFYQRCPAELALLNPNVRVQVLDAARKLAAENPQNSIDVFNDMASVLRPLFFPMQEKVMEREAAISRLSLPASRAFFKHAGAVLSNIPEIFLPYWIKKGLARLTEDEQAGIAYFSLNSEDSRAELNKWKEAVLLDNHKQALSIFAHALAGRPLSLKQRQRAVSGKGASRRSFPPDGKTVYLPAFIADGPDRLTNYRLYKVHIAHQAGCIEFKTFEPLFGKIVSLLKAFPLNLLARDLFFIIEDGRINFLLRRHYRGLRAEIDQTVAACMARRPFPADNPLGEALEILLRLTLGYPDVDWMSQKMRDWTRGLKLAMDGFFESSLGVWDSFKKAAELYESFSRLAEDGLYRPVMPMPFHAMFDLDFFAGADRGAEAPEEADGNDIGIDDAVHSMNEEDIKRLLEKMKDPKLVQELIQDPVGEALFLTDINGVTPTDAVDSPGEKGAGKKPLPDGSPARSLGGNGAFFYDEWDYQQRAYRRNWCTLRERSVPANDLGLFDKIYENYSDLILKVKKEFQRIRPEVLEIVRRVEWGAEIDFNAMIQSVVDRKVGDSPSDQIFTRMEKKVRRISTVLLVDMSASTDRLVSLVNPAGQAQPGSSENPMQAPATGMAPQEKKIIDVEIEGLVVITEALQSLGDHYAIFGFSGYGRQQVDFYSIKEFDDPYSEKVKSRICGIQPQQGTRMGPAIRHAVEKLNQMESDYRLLVLLSDGFPQDLNYGEDRSSKDYGLHDTMMALSEARKSGIRPFCITVDLAGDDYLRKMCDPGSYLIVKNVYSLPEVIPRVVESLVL